MCGLRQGPSPGGKGAAHLPGPPRPDAVDHPAWTVPRQDQLRDDLERNHPEITLKSASYLDTDAFNQLASSSDLMISAPCWSGVHPLLATIPLDCPHTLPYGLIYAKDPPREVMQFIMAVGQVNETE